MSAVELINQAIEDLRALHDRNAQEVQLAREAIARGDQRGLTLALGAIEINAQDALDRWARA